MKRTLEDHRELLRNTTQHAERLRAAADRAIADAERAERHAHEYAQQIALAESRGVTEFDCERFGKTRAKRGANVR